MVTNVDDQAVRPGESAYNLVGLQLRDEQNLTDANIAEAANYLAQWRSLYPETLGYTNQYGTQESVQTLQHYMQVAQPDILMFDNYQFTGDLAGGSPTSFYRDLQKYRELALGGNDGTGRQPIPFGTYLQTWVNNGHVTSESEIRLDQFAAWAFGCTYATAFYYIDGAAFPGLQATMFSTTSDSTFATTFYQMAETNRESLNLGPTLVRLSSTDVGIVLGEHAIDNSIVTNAQPPGVPSWTSGAGNDPYLTSVSAQNLGQANGGLPGDVLIGHFTPLLQSDNGVGFNNEPYFMIVNGLTSPTGTAADAAQVIHLTFNFGTSGITNLECLSRDTGQVEIIHLVSDGGSLYHLDLTLDGGTGDLFKYDDGAPFRNDRPLCSG